MRDGGGEREGAEKRLKMSHPWTKRGSQESVQSQKPGKKEGRK